MLDELADHARERTHPPLRPAEPDGRRERNQLVEDHLGCVDYFVHRYGERGVPRDDLRQVGLLALVQAAERFDPTHGVAFTTFASRTIDGTIKRYFRDRTWLVRPPRGAQELHLRLRAADEQLTGRLSRRPTVAELAREVDADIDHVLEAMEAGAAHRGSSLDETFGHEDDASGRDGYGTIGDDDPSFETVEARSVLDQAMAGLSPRDREVIQLRFFDNLRQDEIAARVGVSQSYLSRIIARALRTMRDELTAA